MPEIIPPALNPRPENPDACIDACLRCARTCQTAALQICLPKGGRHTEPAHFGLILGCAQLCRATAEFMIYSAVLHNKVSGACAEICEACAHSCAEIGGMEDCVRDCRHCAEICRRMALGTAMQ